MGTSIDTVQQFYAAMAQGPDGAAAMTALLSEDTTFNGPILKANSRDEFFAGMAEFDPGAGEIQMRHTFEDGDTVCVVYDFVLPGGTVTNGLITAQELIFDLVDFQAATGT